MTPLPPLPTIDGCLFMDNSGWIEGMNTCSRALQYKSLNGRISTGEKPSLNFGSAIHIALEYRYVKFQNRPVTDEYYNDVSVILTDFFNHHPPPDGDWRGLNWAMEVLRRYNEKYETEDFQLLQYSTPVVCPMCDTFKEKEDCLWCENTRLRRTMVELSFALPLYTTLHPTEGTPLHIFYTGKIDLPNKQGNSLFVRDHKTTGMLGSMFWDQMRMTSAQKGYVWAFQQATGMHVAGYEINAIRTKEPPQYVTQGKAYKGRSASSPEAWWNESLVREKFYVEQDSMEEWKNNVIDLIEEFLWHYKRNYMPMKTSWCSSYGRCQYYDVCQLNSADRGILLASGQFTENKWSPLNKEKSQSKQ